MDEITVRELPDGVKQRLRLRAAVHGRSMEAEARAILLDALANTQQADLTWIQQLMAAGGAVGGVDLEIPEDEPATIAEPRQDPARP